MIDKAFWINSNNRPDRFRNMKERLGIIGLQAERFPALYGGAIDWNNPEFNFFHKHGVKQELNNGEIGCFLSHREIYKKIKDNGWKKTLILEDDCLFNNDFMSHLGYLSGKDFDMLYLGQWNYDKGVIEGEKSALKKEIEKVGDGKLYEAKRCWLTHAYIIDINCIDILLDNTKNLYASVDCVLADIQERFNLNVLAIHPNLVNQDLTKSSLRNL